MHPVTLTITTARSGTKYLYKAFTRAASSNASIYHELLHPMVAKPAMHHRCLDEHRKELLSREPIVQRLIGDWKYRQVAGPVVDFGWTMSSLVPLFADKFGDSLRVIVLHRHPLSYAASASVGGIYTIFDHEYYTLSPSHEGAYFKEYGQRWSKMSAFEKNLFQWLETVHYGLEITEQLPDGQVLLISFDELVSGQDALQRAAAFTGFDRPQEVQASPPVNQRLDQSLESRPLGEEWRSYGDHPEVIALATRLGYDMSEARAREIASRYQVPQGIMPRLRATTRYWQVRGFLAGAMRKAGLLKPENDVVKMSRQAAGELAWLTDDTSQNGSATGRNDHHEAP
jgi:hypothetical protein